MADLLEIFSSIQGEGELLGRRQAFLRFAGCTLACSYCDTPNQATAHCRIESPPGSQSFVTVPNPVTLDIVEGHLAAWRNQWPGLHHSLSITGGEPLMHAEVLSHWLPVLRRILPIQLETNGIMACGLERVIDFLDFISMDIKIPSTSGHEYLWSAHSEFLKIACRKRCWVKVIVGLATTDEEIEHAAMIVADIDPSIPFILQPITAELAAEGIGRGLLRGQAIASRRLADVRVIPQMHTLLRIL